MDEAYDHYLDTMRRIRCFIHTKLMNSTYQHELPHAIPPMPWNVNAHRQLSVSGMCLDLGARASCCSFVILCRVMTIDT
jgi:hypothetical protein